MLLSKEEFVKEFVSAIHELSTNNFDSSTFIWNIGYDDSENHWAIVMDKGSPEEYGIDKPIFEAKIAYQPSNSVMQEYDIDWLMPYDEVTGEVDDTEISGFINSSDEELSRIASGIFDNSAFYPKVA